MEKPELEKPEKMLLSVFMDHQSYFDSYFFLNFEFLKAKKFIFFWN